MTMTHPMAEYANPTALAETSWLGSRLDDPTLAVIEVDEDTTAYAGAHIPGAVALNWQLDLRAAPRRDFVGPERLAEILGGLGVSDEQTIILYGGNNNWFAAYAYWLFRLRGVARVRLLNGGRKKWELEQRPMDTTVPHREATTFRLARPQPNLRAYRTDVLTTDSATLVDVRSPAEFTGELLAPAHLPQEQPQVPGHVPGARNVPWAQAANEDGTFKNAEELLGLYSRAGVHHRGDIITYCRIGERSAHTWFALTELLGYPRVRNYDGSWTEYGSLVDVPVATGPTS
jgi:thiosulfate/3-mercaptopyruvate sulfurtransferase